MEKCIVCKVSKDDSEGKKYTPNEFISKLPLSDTTYPAKKIANDFGEKAFTNLSAEYGVAVSIVKFNNPPGAANQPNYWICNKCKLKYFRSKKLDAQKKPNGKVLSAKKIVFPDFCSCCLKETKEKFEITKDRDTFKIPFCEVCHKHLISPGRVLLYSLIIALITSYIFYIAIPALKFTIIIILFIFVFIFSAVLILKYFYPKIWPLFNSGHISADLPVEIFYNYRGIPELIFYNKKYQKLFNDVNRESKKNESEIEVGKPSKISNAPKTESTRLGKIIRKSSRR